jgi:hypothetical protein
MSGINHWKGKVPFEDYVTERLYEIDNKLTETNRLLSVIAGEEALTTDDVIADVVTDSQDSFIAEMKSNVLDFASDFLDDGRVNGSNKKRKE